MDAHWQGRAIAGDGIDDGFRDDAVTKRHLNRLVTFPPKALHKEGSDTWRNEPHGSRPGAALFDHQMACIERDAKELRVDVVEDLIEIPDGGAGVFRSGMILVKGLDADRLVHGRKLTRLAAEARDLLLDGRARAVTETAMAV